jgi:predicted transcriptional regulator
MSAILAAAQPIAIDRRDAFLQAVAAALASHPGELGDGAVHRVVAQVQRQFFSPPDVRHFEHIDRPGKLAKAAARGEKQGAHITFASVDLMHRVLTPARWNLLRAMMGGEPVGVRALARNLRRDVKSVHGDVHALLAAGVLQKADDGRLLFPFDAVHVDFRIEATG